MKKTLFILLALVACATTTYAVRYTPGQIHSDGDCRRVGGRFIPSRLVCEAVVHGPYRQDWVVRYRETSEKSDGFQLGKDTILSHVRAGRCAWK